MSDDHGKAQTIPRPILLAAGAMVVLAVALAGFGQISGLGRVGLPDAEVIASKDLRFEDRGNGKVVVFSAKGATALAPENGGFMLGIVRGLGRERMLHGADPDAPYTLTRWSDGRLSLLDQATGHEVQISAFGPTNVQTFASLLKPEDAVR